MRTPPTPLHHIIAVGPFAKWGIDFITCNPHSTGGHAYIILVVDSFTKWVEAMPTFSADNKTAVIFVFNHIITRFGVPQAIITDHGSHFRNIMMIELTDQLALRHDSSTPYYPQANGLMSTPLQTYIGFTDGACHSTQNISSAAWVIYSPSDELVSMHGVSLGQTMNNIVEYSAVIELLSESISFGIQSLIVRLDSELVVLQLNRVYAIRNPVLLRLFLRVRLLEREFDYIEY
eukprot:PITA_26715